MKTNFKEWLKYTAIRAAKTFAETALAVIGTSAVVLQDVNWTIVFSSAALAAIICVLTCVAGIPEVKKTPEA